MATTILDKAIPIKAKQNYDELEELFAWGRQYAKENNITEEKSRRLLKLARKIINENSR